MSDQSKTEDKPEKLYFESYIQVIKNSAGSGVFRNFYVRTPGRGKFDALADGDNACAFFVSAILALFKKLDSFHGTVKNTVEDLQKSGWQLVDKPRLGDVIIWEPQKFGDKLQEHIGFYIGDNKAVSTSWKTKTVVEHEVDFGPAGRKVTHIYRMMNWDDQPSAS